MKIIILAENLTFTDDHFYGEPGVSYWVEADGKNILFDGVNVGESTFEGAFGLRFVTVKEVEEVEVGVDPKVGIGAALVEGGFVVGEGTLTAQQKPAGQNGVTDKKSVFVSRGLIVFEAVLEQGEELVGVFVLEEEGLGGACVCEVVEAGGGLSGDTAGSRLISHKSSFLNQREEEGVERRWIF